MAFLTLKNVSKVFGNTTAVEDFNLEVEKGEFVSFLGPSGCGKTTTLRMIAGFELPTSGIITLDGEDITYKSPNQRNVGMVFQSYALFPNLTIGQNIGFGLQVRKMPKEEMEKRIDEMLSIVHLEAHKNKYPHQLSGAMQQRAMIGMALSGAPALLIADEPTTALDVTIQAQILDLLVEIQASTGMALLLITHDLGVISRMAGRISVMYAGKIVEEGPTGDVLSSPRHPYTRALIRSIPRIGDRRRRLEAIGGAVPDPLDLPSGCRFHPRCGLAEGPCREMEPDLRPSGPGRRSACHFFERMEG